MNSRTTSTLAVAIVIVAAALPRLAASHATSFQRPVGDLTDDDYWKVIHSLSEDPGYYSSDNLASSERRFGPAVAVLADRRMEGTAYIGVGPEQNFHYIAALKPTVAFIVDIRSENRALHLLYKAIFELSSNRTEFLAMLFSRERPSGSSSGRSASELVSAFRTARPVSRARFDQNVRAVLDLLMRRHRFVLSAADQAWVRFAYESFYRQGPELRYSATREGPASSGAPSYGEILAETDDTGTPRSFLASEQSFSGVRDLHLRNRILLVVGDFAGPRALRSIADYLRSRNVTLSVFYVSDVEPVLVRAGRWLQFCSNMASLPVTAASYLLRSAPPGPLPAWDGSIYWPTRAEIGTTGFSVDSIQSQVRRCVQGR